MQHENGTAEIRVRDHSPQNGRADVVRQIADRSEWTGREGGSEGVGVYDDVTESLLEARGEHRIDLDRHQLVAAGGKLFGEDAFARADLQNHLSWLRFDGSDNFLDRAAVTEKVLPPLFLR